MTDYLYSAFISYRHVEPDQTIARRIQHSIETFQIPGVYRTERKKSHFRKVFRDSDELSLDKDLASGIDYALSQSEFLIVILSEQYKISEWCIHEIHEFLKTHDRSQILCVLAKGEPRDVLPDVLTYIPAEDGSDKVIYREPLCADYRLDRTTADRLELPRLLSSMLRCSYDDLMKRQEIYRRKRFAQIAGTVLVVLTTIILLQMYNLARLNTAYKDTQYSQSQTLAAQSVYNLDNFDRKLALGQAIEALPSPGMDDRPLTADAIYALSKATYAYRPSAFAQTRSRSMQYNIIRYGITPQLHRIVTMDEKGWILVQNKTGDHLANWPVDGTASGFGFTIQDDYTILAWRGGNLYSYDYENYARNWCVKIIEDSLDMSDPDSGILSTAIRDASTCSVLSGDSVAIVNLADGATLGKLDSSAILGQLNLDAAEDGTAAADSEQNYAFTFMRQFVTEDGELILSGSLSTGKDDSSLLCNAIWNPDSGALTVYSYDLPAYCVELKKVNESRLIVVAADKPFSVTNAENLSREDYNNEFRTLIVLCFDLTDGSPLWDYDTEMPQAVLIPRLDYVVPKADGESALISVTFEVDNYIFDLETGTLFSSVTLPESIILVDHLDYETASFYCCNHKYYTIRHEDGYVIETEGLDPFPEQVQGSTLLENCILAFTGKYIYWFERISDTSAVQNLSLPGTVSYFESADCGVDQIAVLADSTLAVLDIKESKLLRQGDLNLSEDPNFYAVWTIAGSLPDEAGVLLVGLCPDDGRTIVKAFDSKNSEITDLYAFPASEDNSFSAGVTTESWKDSIFYCNGILYNVPDTERNTILYYNALTNTSGQIEITGIPDSLIMADVYNDFVSEPVVTLPIIAVSPDGKCMFSTVYDPANAAMGGAVIDLETGEARVLDTSFTFLDTFRFAAFNEDHSVFACCTDYSIRISLDDLTRDIDIPISGTVVESMTWYNNELYIAFTNHTIRRYSTEGDLLSNIKLDYQDTLDLHGPIYWIPLTVLGSRDALMYVNDCNMNLISADTESATPLFYIPSFVGWGNESDLFVTYHSEEILTEDSEETKYSLYFYPNYSYEELIDKGVRQLEDMQ